MLSTVYRRAKNKKKKMACNAIFFRSRSRRVYGTKGKNNFLQGQTLTTRAAPGKNHFYEVLTTFKHRQVLKEPHYVTKFYTMLYLSIVGRFFALNNIQGVP